MFLQYNSVILFREIFCVKVSTIVCFHIRTNYLGIENIFSEFFRVEIGEVSVETNFVLLNAIEASPVLWDTHSRLDVFLFFNSIGSKLVGLIRKKAIYWFH